LTSLGARTGYCGRHDHVAVADHQVMGLSGQALGDLRTPSDLVAARSPLTGEHLAAHVGG
jgi:hypothetical protein